ncbi:pilin N-terminal domain-containing protein [Corynebacterium mendelii]|uniref:LPXTG cell wall anchor domain-containing protein n=1 Tax=Corynebacterium mendelii TaxID=2765362 RepID=A0A939DYU2_9CORY|nr:SpaA isopeptide-forming pilin-related protein [Corynebacterium mendelii]MBN9643750.1 LPXTG cell wall anchor domain-containing protein [Corynebacterium mendelii]
MTKKKLFSSAVAALGATAMLATATTPVAGAVEFVSGEVVENMVPSTIDGTKTVTFTIKKTKNPSDVDDGSVWVTEGVPFTIKRVPGIDITTEAGWDKLKEMSLVDIKLADGESVTKKTNADGEVTFDNLEPGVYLVSEQQPVDAPDGYRIATPFVTILPVADGETKTWRYNVTITPKTEPLGRTKPQPAETPTPSPTPRPTPTPEIPDGSSFIPFLPIIPIVVFPPGPPPKPQPVPSVPPQPNPVPPPPPPAPSTQPFRPPLANTGANVLGVFGIGALILIVGAVIVIARRKKDRGV